MFCAEGKYHFFFGDETAIGFFDDARKKICFPEKKYIGILELNEAYQDLPERLGLLVDIVPCTGENAEHSIQLLHQLEPEVWELWKDGIFHLTGERSRVLPFRAELKKIGIPDSKILIY